MRPKGRGGWGRPHKKRPRRYRAGGRSAPISRSRDVPLEPPGELEALVQLRAVLKEEQRLSAEVAAVLLSRSEQCGQQLRQVRGCIRGLLAGAGAEGGYSEQAEQLLQAGKARVEAVQLVDEQSVALSCGTWRSGAVWLRGEPALRLGVLLLLQRRGLVRERLLRQHGKRARRSARLRRRQERRAPAEEQRLRETRRLERTEEKQRRRQVRCELWNEAQGRLRQKLAAEKLVKREQLREERKALKRQLAAQRRLSEERRQQRERMWLQRQEQGQQDHQQPQHNGKALQKENSKNRLKKKKKKKQKKQKKDGQLNQQQQQNQPSTASASQRTRVRTFTVQDFLKGPPKVKKLMKRPPRVKKTGEPEGTWCRCFWDPEKAVHWLERRLTTRRYLQLEKAGQRHLEVVQRMPQLCSLSVVRCAQDLHKDPWKPMRGWAARLRWLRLNSLPGWLVRSLLAAHRDSLQELRLEECGWPDLPALLSLPRLRRLRLPRHAHAPHLAAPPCAAVRAALPACRVVCGSCDPTPGSEPA